MRGRNVAGVVSRAVHIEASRTDIGSVLQAH